MSAGSARFEAVVDSPHSAQRMYDYLADPRNRPQWQSSLLSVQLDQPAAAPHEGMSWRDITVTGMRARMRIDELVPAQRIVETGSMLGISGRLTLHFIEKVDGCQVRVEGEMSAPRGVRYAVLVAARVAGLVAKDDLRRANRVLSRR